MKLVALDVDGTLLTSSHELSVATIAAVAAVRASGMDVVLASSRGAGLMKGVLRTLDLLEPVEFIAAQGALTGSLAGDGVLRVVHQAAIPLALAHEMVALADEAGFAASWFRGFDWFVPRMDESIEADAAAVGRHPVVRDLFAVTREPEKLMLVAPPEKVHKLAAIAARLPHGLAAQTSGASYLEITASGVDKGVALARMCARRGIAPGDVVAIGDGRNDIALFDFAGTSIAMANAAESVRERAMRVTGSNDADGVASALVELLRA